MKKILHILISGKFSGAENMVCEIINMHKGNDQYKMAYCSPEGQIREVLAERNIEYIPMKEFSFKEIRKVIKEYEPNIIHAHDAKASTMVACVFKNGKIISHIHGNHDNMKVLSIKSLLYLICSIRFKHIFWVSGSSLRDYKFQRYIKHKSSILYNIIDTDALEVRMQNDKNVYNYDCVFLGRLCDIKDPIRMINVLYNVVQEYPELRAAIIGDGILKDEVINFIKERKLESNIFVLGFKENPLKILHDAKVMIMTSKYEGTPMCALEAMALGVPIVSTPTDGLKELVVHGVTGMLSNDDHELSLHIKNIVLDKKLQLYLSNQALIKAKQWNNKENYINRLHEAYGI